jgi:hypothetical protein
MSAQNMSLFIPHVFANVTKERIISVFQDLDLATVKYIDLVPKQDREGKKFNSVYVHFEKWHNDNSSAVRLQQRLEAGELDVRVVYDDPWYWVVLKNNIEKKETSKKSKNNKKYKKPVDEDVPVPERKVPVPERKVSELPAPVREAPVPVRQAQKNPIKILSRLGQGNGQGNGQCNVKCGGQGNVKVSGPASGPVDVTESLVDDSYTKQIEEQLKIARNYVEQFEYELICADTEQSNLRREIERLNNERQEMWDMRMVMARNERYMWNQLIHFRDHEYIKSISNMSMSNIDEPLDKLDNFMLHMSQMTESDNNGTNSCADSCTYACTDAAYVVEQDL